MAVRAERGAGLRRAARGRAGAAALALALFVAAGLLSTWPALRDGGSHFLAYGAAREGRVTPGDHLQTAYALWLPGHQLARGAAPWLDPYSFQPVVSPRVDFAGWPFSVAFGPLEWLLGTVRGWNAFVLLGFVGAGGLTTLWLRALGLPLGAALVGGLAFALAPYRVAQTAGGHLLAPVSMLLPLALYGVERRRTWRAAASLASIPLSGQVHLALGAIPFVLAYALVRGRRAAAWSSAGAAVAAGLLVWAVSLRGNEPERPFAEVERYSAHLGDFLGRTMHEFERFVLLGWLVPLLALAGVLLARRRDLAAVLAAGVAVPVLFALGSTTPLYEPLWRTVPGLGSTRVPERLLPIACLCLAGLAAIAVARLPRGWMVALAGLAVVVDLRAGVELFRPLNADEGNRAYAALREQPPGRV
ncbi:MAG TPA: hypothetical protein VLB86_12730, partial [Gaiellaceae bacterium]|nr:hypothetical protein [Gaiellaceae bacterium]